MTAVQYLNPEPAAAPAGKYSHLSITAELARIAIFAGQIATFDDQPQLRTDDVSAHWAPPRPRYRYRRIVVLCRQTCGLELTHVWQPWGQSVAGRRV